MLPEPASRTAVFVSNLIISSRTGAMNNDQNSSPAAQPENADDFFEQATRCRRLARGIEDRAAAEILERMAVVYDAQARSLKA